jgi:hypothetical protein
VVPSGETLIQFVDPPQDKKSNIASARRTPEQGKVGNKFPPSFVRSAAPKPHQGRSLGCHQSFEPVTF